ncbi:unnamed protein product, partial [Ixodes hexagonus]
PFVCLLPYVKCVCACKCACRKQPGLVSCLSSQIGFVDEVPSDLSQLFIPSPRRQHLGAVLGELPVWPSPLTSWLATLFPLLARLCVNVSFSLFVQYENHLLYLRFVADFTRI